MADQIALDLQLPARSYIRRRGEADRVYDAVIALRRRGFAVYRVSDCQHAVDGRLVTTGELIRLSERV